MKNLGIFSVLFLVVGFSAVACGDSSDDSDVEDKNSDEDESDQGDGGDEDTGGGGNEDTGGNAEAEVAGSCYLEGMFCLTYECIGQTMCDNMAIGGPDGCEMAGGEWSDTACTEENAIGMCREPDPDGDTITVYYEDGLLDAEMAEETCQESDGTFTTP